MRKADTTSELDHWRLCLVGRATRLALVVARSFHNSSAGRDSEWVPSLLGPASRERQEGMAQHEPFLGARQSFPADDTLKH